MTCFYGVCRYNSFPSTEQGTICSVSSVKIYVIYMRSFHCTWVGLCFLNNFCKRAFSAQMARKFHLFFFSQNFFYTWFFHKFHFGFLFPGPHIPFLFFSHNFFYTWFFPKFHFGFLFPAFFLLLLTLFALLLQVDWTVMASPQTPLYVL